MQDKMSTLEKGMLIVYFMMFGIIFVFTLLNFFLAIIVNTFVEVKQEIETEQVLLIL